jgi:hypothetical protein
MGQPRGGCDARLAQERDLSRATGAICSVLAMATDGKVMISYLVDREDGGIWLEKVIEQKDDDRYIIFYTFEDEED